MSFASTSAVNAAGNPSSRLIQSETVTLANAGDAVSSSFEVAKNADFVSFLNTGATNTTGAVTTDLQGSFDGSTWADIDASFAADLDTAMIVKSYDASASGDFPFYRFQFTCAADDSATTIVVKVVS